MKILLHSCCAPCSSSVITSDSDIISAVYFYNPNVLPKDEYEKRLSEQNRLCDILNVPLFTGAYEPEKYEVEIKGFEDFKEGNAKEISPKCERCFRLRLFETARFASLNGFNTISTTLTVSPHKNAVLINKILSEAAEKYNLSPYTADFKKKDGYLKSIQLSKKYELYRQSYCGCTPPLTGGAT